VDIVNEKSICYIFHKENHEKESDIAKWLIISQSSVTKVWALYKTTGSYSKLTFH
jgi:hypothetical protein